MKKLTLDLDGLEVDSFAIDSPRARVGTIRAHDDSFDTDSTAPCAAATEGGDTCETTGFQIICTCTQGGEPWQTCDANCNSVQPNCW